VTRTPAATVFDSTILIAHLRGDTRATELLLSVPSDDRLISVLSKVEIEGGMRSSERGDVARLFGAVRLLPVGDAIASQAGAFLRTFRRSHHGIDVVDYVIAATAAVMGAELATFNVKHFPMFAGLKAPF